MALTVSHSTKDFLSSSPPFSTSLPFFFSVSLSSLLSPSPSFLSSFFSMSFPQKILIEQLLYSKHISYVTLDFCDLVREREKKQHSTSWVKELITGQKDSAVVFRTTLILQQKEKCYLQFLLATFLLPKGIWLLAWYLH